MVASSSPSTSAFTSSAMKNEEEEEDKKVILPSSEESLSDEAIKANQGVHAKFASSATALQKVRSKLYTNIAQALCLFMNTK